MKNTISMSERIRKLHHSVHLPNNNAGLVMGVGGAGAIIVDYLFNQLRQKFDFIIADSDVKVISSFPDLPYLLLGESKLAGLGCSSPANGVLAAKASEKELQSTMFAYKEIILVLGLGGGCGTGSSMEIIKMAKLMDITIHIITLLPFEFENRHRLNALQYREEIKVLADSYYEFDNQQYFDQLMAVNASMTLEMFYLKIQEAIQDYIVAELLIEESVYVR